MKDTVKITEEKIVVQRVSVSSKLSDFVEYSVHI